MLAELRPTALLVLNAISRHRTFAAIVGLAILSKTATRLPAQETPRENPPGSHQVEIGEYQFRVRDGYKLTRIAGESLISRPTVADWDHSGNLVVVESAGAVGSVEEQLEDKPHRLVRLFDDNGDGIFDRRIIVAEELGFYSGVLCDGDDIYVSAPPKIWKLTDSDQDGVCESRTVWHDGGTLTYCANDLHGPYLGPDGWIYWCKGAFGEQTHKLSNGTTMKSSAAHILRKRREGGPVEIVTSGGMDNPIEITFLPNGELFFTSTFLQHPSAGNRDGIAHAVHGSIFGKPHGVIDGFWRTGDLMPITTHLGPAAPSGLTRLRHGSPSQHVLACAQFNLHKVTTHTLAAKGASYETIDQSLVECDRIDFHPTDVIEDQDGSLIFLDTGDWYDLCCPSSGAEGKRAPGGIYRLSRVGTTSQQDRSAKATIEDGKQAFDALSDDRPQVRDQAAEWLVAHPQALFQTVRHALEIDVLDKAIASRLIWSLSRLHGSNHSNEASKLIVGFLRRDDCPEAQHAALNGLTHFEHVDLSLVCKLLKDSPDAGVRRAAAQRIGQHGSLAQFDVLFEAFDEKTASDRVFEHSLLFAMIQLTSPKRVFGPESNAAQPHLAATEKLLSFMGESHDDYKQAAALQVLDQLAPQVLDAADLVRLFASENARLHALATDALCRHPEWTPSIGQTLVNLAIAQPANSNQWRSATQVLSAWIERPAIRQIWSQRFAERPMQQEWLQLLTAIAVSEIPADWDSALALYLIGKTERKQNPEQRRSIAEWLTRCGRLDVDQHPQLTEALLQLSSDPSASVQKRLAYASALPTSLKPDQHKLSAIIVEALLKTEDSASHQLAANLVESLRIGTDSAEALLMRLDEATTLTLPAIVTAIANSDVGLAEQLLIKLDSLPVARTLPADFLPNRYRTHSRLADQVERLAKRLSAPPAEIAASLESLQASLPKGDMVRGMRVFHGTKAACGSCHEMGDVGGRIGPELTKIGKSRTRTALLEAIVFPSSHIAQGYRSVRILTVDGAIHHGLLQRETPTDLALINGTRQVITISKADIENRVESDISIMPAGLDGSMSKQELADVLELLTTYTAW